QQPLEVGGRRIGRLWIGRGRRLLVGHDVECTLRHGLHPHSRCSRPLTSCVVVNDQPASALPYADVRAEIDGDATRAAATAANAEYLDRVRTATDRFALRTAAPDDIRAAVALLEEQTDVQASAPVDSRNRAISGAKVVVRKTVFFAMNHLAEQ